MIIEVVVRDPPNDIPPRPEPPAPPPPPPPPPAPPAPPDKPSAGLPVFQWPPPRWSARIVLPGAIASPNDRLGEIFDRLHRALDRAGIAEWSVYAVGTSGFAIVSRIEQIYDDGRPALERWSVSPAQPRPFSVLEYVKALFNERPGRYRVIAFVVTDLPVTASSETPTRQSMERMLRSGAGHLPETLRSSVLLPSGRCEALVYEFLRATRREEPHQVLSGGLTAFNHLIGAGLWSPEELRRSPRREPRP